MSDTNEKTPLSSPCLNKEEYHAVLKILKNNWLTKGALTQKFEHSFSTFTKSRYTIGVSSCTAAIHLALLCLDLHEGDHILIPSITYISTLHTLLHMKLTPVLVDIDPNTLNICHKDLERKYTKKCKALIVTDMLGRPCNYTFLNNYCHSHAITLISDAAHSVGSCYNTTPVGSLAEITCFSFYPTKNLASAEGGAFCTRNYEYYEKAKLYHMHGIDHSAWKRHNNNTIHWEVISPGYKYNMTDIQAAIAIEQLKKLPKMKKKRQALFNKYQKELKGENTLQLPPKEKGICWHLFGIQLDLDKFKVNRDTFAKALINENIAVGFHFIPIHWHPYFKKKLPPQDLPHTEKVGTRILSLPLHPKMSNEHVSNITKTLAKVIKKHTR
jgi:dTDP-4-amino-4,6-dideoxygalactose transaminase